MLENTKTYEIPNWYTSNKSKLIIDPYDESFNKISFIKNDKNINTSIYKSNKLPLINYEQNKNFNYLDASTKLINNFQKAFLKVKNNLKKETNIKNLITKLNKNASSLNTVTRVIKYQLSLGQRPDMARLKPCRVR